MSDKKKHHFIAQTYLHGFCNKDGKVHVYSKDDPAKHWWASPGSIGFEKYYYSQPTPDGGRDNNKLEDFFGSIETQWPILVSAIERRERRDGALDQLLQFALMHRVRVPTARDAVEKILAESVRMTARHLNDLGELPPPPPGFTFDELDRSLVVSIDPHKSIHAIGDLAKGAIHVFRAVGFKIIENVTGQPFVTSDNPVLYFDPTLPSQLMQPYGINPRTMNIEFMFPINRRFMLWGHSALKPGPSMPYTVHYHRLTDSRFVKRTNVLSARFAHRMVFSSESRHQPLVEKYGAASPVISVTHIETARGRGLIARYIFGARYQKPKWNATQSKTDQI